MAYRSYIDITDIKQNIRLIKKIRSFIKKENLTYESAKGIFNPHILNLIFVKKDSVPIEVFHSNLGALEAIIKYLKENIMLDFSEISKILGRSIKTIWASYNKSMKKMQEPFSFEKITLEIPLIIFKDRNLGVQENIVLFLKDSQNWSYHQIAVALNRDDRTIWTSYQRARKKMNKEKERGIK